jgi:glycosyltransferase involved in cell wall biosynthesis
VPRVSVIVPAYNSAAYLRETLRSIEQQSYRDFEVIVVDDASRDGTLEVASSAGGVVRALRSERNLGPAGARNLGLEHASGELVALLDADDTWLPGYLERQVSRLEAERARGRRVGIVACNARMVVGPGERPRTFLDHFRGSLEPLTLERVLAGNPIFISALVVRQAGEEAGWFATELFGTEDHDLWIRILELGYEAVLNRQVLAVYRQPPGSVSSDIARMGAGNQRTYDRALARGRLTPKQRRVVRAQIRYNRAMEAVAAARFAGDPAIAIRRLPTLLRVALTHPRSWPDWMRVVTGR